MFSPWHAPDPATALDRNLQKQRDARYHHPRYSGEGCPDEKSTEVKGVVLIRGLTHVVMTMKADATSESIPP